ncbi:replication-relaxation family protein [Algirhabdus cladophorae]|uniref:replication-relaxation family protein n=1 Tax=Algirhabdus cladophorae TaxID=3377108 RepID=UPI003B84B02F
MTGKRSRFRRSKATTIQLTERDVTILKALEQHRFLTTDHLLALTNGTSRQGITRRLRELYDTKYIDRPRAQMMAMAYADKRPMMYGLGNEGAELLSNRFQMALPDIYWTEKNRRVKEKFVEHTLGISDFMVSLETACSDAGNIRIITKDAILTASPEATRRRRHPFRWQTRIHWNNLWHDIAIVPDIIFGLHYTDQPQGKNKAYFMVEIDRGTMPIIRTDIGQTSFARKLHSYADTFERKLHVEHFGIKNFRVLTVTTSHERIENMIAAYRSEIVERAPAGLFLFRSKNTTFASILEWQSATKHNVEIAPPTTKD